MRQPPEPPPNRTRRPASLRCIFGHKRYWCGKTRNWDTLKCVRCGDESSARFVRRDYLAEALDERFMPRTSTLAQRLKGLVRLGTR